MRVLYATDGSAQAELAADLITNVDWRRGTVVRIVSAIDSGALFFGAPWAPAVPASMDDVDDRLTGDAERAVKEAAQRFAAAGIEVEGWAVKGRAASVIVDEATEWRADLIVTGSRGHGEIASMLLGSVSSEVVDHAPCPVLVARRSRLTRAVLGHDGSDCARHAESVVSRWPIFDKVAVEVVDVAPAGVPWSTVTQATYAGSVEPYVESVRAIEAADQNVAEAAADRLRRAGRSATASVAHGAPATELIRVAEQRAADLIVVGTRGRTGLRRLVLGSVARNVLHHASCSVLIVR
jgi:nucleotide-binding universal stress UspA family protein